MSDKKDDKIPTQPQIQITGKLYENTQKPPKQQPSDKKDK